MVGRGGLRGEEDACSLPHTELYEQNIGLTCQGREIYHKTLYSGNMYSHSLSETAVMRIRPLIHIISHFSFASAFLFLNETVYQPPTPFLHFLLEACVTPHPLSPFSFGGLCCCFLCGLIVVVVVVVSLRLRSDSHILPGFGG